MKTSKISISAYLSHPIRGMKGAEATAEDMALNNDLAALVSTMLEQACPALDLYVPAKNDEYITEAYIRGSASEEEILEIDKIILERRDIIILFCYNGVVSTGMGIEKDHADFLGKPSFSFSKVTDIPELVESIIDWYYNKESI